jgi:hypothetical protein
MIITDISALAQKPNVIDYIVNAITLAIIALIAIAKIAKIDHLKIPIAISGQKKKFQK